MKKIGRALAGLVLALPLWVCAHQDGSESDVDAVGSMDCEHPPADAVRKLPEPLSRWGRLSCYPSGQMLTQSADAQWRYPGSWTEQVMLPARTADDSTDAKPRYFTDIKVRQLDRAEARETHQQMMKRNAVYADRLVDANTRQAPDAPKAAWEVSGTNNTKSSFRLYLMQHDGRQDIWGLMCAPECEAHLSFIVTPLD